MYQKTSEFEQYVERIKGAKAKLTPQRIEILNIFLNDKHTHFTAEDILNRLSSSMTGQATVYRTLELFSQIGILKKVNFTGDEFTQYDLIDLDNKHFHHHLVCNSCQKIIEINDDLLESVEDRIQQDHRFLIENHELVLRGICQECQEDMLHE
jgi:Fur family transcriptional regulator, ferric uptake regulator